MRVWLIGSGFSARLGGPLLRDLLQPGSLAALRIRHPGTWVDAVENDLAIAIYRLGIAADYWKHAEDFLTALCSQDLVHYRRIGELRKAAASELQIELQSEDTYLRFLTEVATALIAAQCADFSERKTNGREAWLPYDRWARAVTSNDVIVSFNYDDVVERAFMRNDKKLYVPSPRDLYTESDWRKRYGPVTNLRPAAMPYKPVADRTRLLKLHGSIDFREGERPPMFPPEDAFADRFSATSCASDDPIASLAINPALIAIPGDQKVLLTGAELDFLWLDAAAALSTATSVSLIGYSCPPSDEKAKALLIDTLASNKSRPTVDLVLGPGRDSSILRLSSLLSGAGVNVSDTGLWAEDYLSVIGVGQGWNPTNRYAARL